MKRLFGRVARLIVQPKAGASVIVEESLRFTFATNKSTATAPNTCTVQVSNMALTTINKLSEADGLMTVEAGYDESDGALVVFVGNIDAVKTVQEGVDRTTTFELTDGGVALRDMKSSVSFASGTALKTVVESLVADIGLPMRHDVELSDLPQVTFPTGLALFGSTRTMLEQMGTEHGFSFSIQNGEAVIGTTKGTQSRGGAIRLSGTTGVVGTPQKTLRTVEKNSDANGNNIGVSGYTVVAKLMPTIVPNDGVELLLSGEIIATVYRCVAIQHAGDTHGELWESRIELEEV